MALIRGVLFDWDGVLVDTMPFYVNAWQQAFASVGISDIPVREWYLREGQERESCIREVYRKFAGQDINLYTLRKINQIKERVLRDSYDLLYCLLPGAMELLYFLKSQAVNIALVTGSSSLRTKEAVKRLFPDIFGAAVFGDHVQRSKPYPDPYLVGLERLGLTASECVVVENGPLGIRSACAAKLCCFALRSPVLEDNILYEAGADKIFDSHIQLVEYFREFLLYRE